MRVRLRVGMTGARNGVEWPPRGAEMDLPEDEAQQMIAGGLAESVTLFPKPAESVITNQARAGMAPRPMMRGRQT